MKKRWWVAAGIFFTVVVTAAALGCGGAEKEQSPGSPSFDDISGKGVSDAALSGLPDAESTVGDEARGTAEVSGAAAGLPQLQLKVIKSALVNLETEKGGYAKLKEEAAAAASAAGGFVENESASKDGEGFTHATLTLRVPAERFDEVMSRISSLGEAISTQVSTSDVSGEYVDLESRLKHLQAEESFYLALIAKAESVEEMISIREHLSSIQLEKEQLQGRKDYLDRQISYSTLTLSVNEVSPEEGEGFWHEVGDAFRSFGRGMRALALGIFYALPYLILLALLTVLVWWLIRRSRKPKDAS